MNEELQIIRRRILAQLEKAACPLSLPDVVELNAGRFADAVVRDQVAWLERRNYIENAYRFDEPLYRITDSGQAQLNKTVRVLDPDLWGRIAL